MKGFDITDIDSWVEASDKREFVWKDNTFFNEETGGNIAEKEFTAFIGQIISALRQVSSDEKIADTGLSNIITLIIDLLSAGLSANNALLLVNMGIDNDISFSWSIFEIAKQLPENDKKIFDINNQDTWRFATENNLVFAGKSFHISPGKKFTEILFVKIMNLIFYASMTVLHSRYDLRDITISTLLEGLKQGENVVDIVNKITTLIKDRNNIVSSRQVMINSIPSQTNHEQSSPINNTVNTGYLTPPSKIFLIIGIGLVVGGFLYLCSVATGNWTPGKLIFGMIITFCSIPFFAKYSSKQSKFFYKVVCADMARWVGHSSNDLIIQWGAPTKTYKFPSDKTMTVLEYKDSIRNYAGYRYKGMYAGQSKTTKYIKSFFVKDGIIVNYKYAIT
ncbi:hypothetical protein FACS189485_19080 [Spirochaetia bacterium]|nr:hypothetical protein FACS189485_19080 [Spirochaetia bacterium]